MIRRKAIELWVGRSKWMERPPRENEGGKCVVSGGRPLSFFATTHTTYPSFFFFFSFFFFPSTVLFGAAQGICMYVCVPMYVCKLIVLF